PGELLRPGAQRALRLPLGEAPRRAQHPGRWAGRVPRRPGDAGQPGGGLAARGGRLHQRRRARAGHARWRPAPVPPSAAPRPQRGATVGGAAGALGVALAAYAALSFGTRPDALFLAYEARNQPLAFLGFLGAVAAAPLLARVPLPAMAERDRSPAATRWALP